MKTTCFILFALLLVSAANAASFLCVTDAVTGFAFDKNTKTWGETHFKPTGNYLVSHPSRPNDKDYAWVVTPIGSESPSAGCVNDFEYDTLHCAGSIFYFKFNKSNLRFISAYMSGYWTDTGYTGPFSWDEGLYQPNMEIGKCSRID